ncbi:MAG: alpha/beta fold hydrolase [Microgenomates group bacterium]
MKHTKLIEFDSGENTLRGLWVDGEVKSKEVVVMLPGFERTAISEKKFKLLADRLAEKGVSSFRFDYAGFGISDGDFSKTTVSSMVADYLNVRKMIERLGSNPSMVVAHSLSGCVIASVLQTNILLKQIVLLATALNQKDLMRYWFVTSNMKLINPNLQITWENYKKYLDEAEFANDCQKEVRMTKVNSISKLYYQENMNKDYVSGYKNSLDKVLLIHGDRDTSVPLNSLDTTFSNQIIVKGGDHDLERVDMAKQWVDKCVEFLTK